MASIQVGGVSSRKSLDSELPLVPFIDLLLCCVMFLLVAAVWNRLSSVEVATPSAGTPTAPIDAPSLTLSMSAERWLLVTSESARFEMPAGDVAALGEALEGQAASVDELVVAPDDGVAYDAVIAAIDVALAEGITSVSMAGDGAR